MAKGLFSMFRRNKSSKQDEKEIKQDEQEQQSNPRDADATEDCAQVTADSAAGKPLPEVEPEPPKQSEPEPEPEPEPEVVSADETGAESSIEPEAASATESEAESAPEAAPAKKKGLWARLTEGLKRTSGSIGSGLFGVFKGKKIDEDLFEELETQLLMADLGVKTTTKIIDNLTQQADRKQLKDAEALYELLQEQMEALLEPVDKPLAIDTSKMPYVILMTGVNGVGKTTTIGKLAKQFKREGKSVMLAAGDTFRAAAVEQLQIWGERNEIPVIAQQTGSDSASVLFDAMQAAKARGIDVLIADTAGRLQNKSNLMEELKKIVRVMKKQDPEAPHEVMLTLDAGTGQNAISQAKLFTEAVGVSGIVMTKLDGTAKGGVIFAVADEFKIPIRYIGVGEQLDDLRPFVARDFIQALFDRKLDQE
ncbi:signal recognition particle-docking protein FtsY [Idiomarina sp.]|uniref:signal recognition particle-docking protein FtsY n=1 Tax=Idiomarina sp. TaxID=1874361 RepID=UPI002582FE6F|nr:signal recognition particle-docking protein FtsY [Idiomarina sp.]